ncbi:unnamed protein product [Echinostoma caproni]|uniref:PK_Tyr_Ser-Thr domain-containing protein n=1 Tax=Echinostoma caproni TaxID=27848 RepID=A0A183BDD7_9TREM|nr:unnamed protein product [Echinostoma caproni]
MPQHIRAHMSNCWLADPEKRPSFAELSRSLQVTNGTNAQIGTKHKSDSTSETTNESRDLDDTSRRFTRFHIAVKDKRNREP